MSDIELVIKMEDVSQDIVPEICEKTKTASSKLKTQNKLLRRQIREQMEFYFSDSNLSKDRFINQEILKDPEGYVDLNLFLKFNKIKSLAEDLNSLAKALDKSETLELDSTKTKVRRQVPYVAVSQDEINRRTVYVENLPTDVTHDLLKRIFSRCGKVCYISLPKYKTTKEIKGFAFIEFDSRQSAKNAIKMMNEPANEKEEDEVEEEDEKHVGMFPKYNKQLIHLEEKLMKTHQILESTAESATEDKKRKLDDSGEASNEPCSKEPKLESDEKAEGDGAQKKKKKTRRRVHAVVNAKKLQKEIEEEAAMLHLKVLSKKEWLRLKEEYLKKQKENMALLKAKLRESQKIIEDTKKKNKEEKMSVDKQAKKDTIKTENEMLNESDEEIVANHGKIVKIVQKDFTQNFDHVFKMNKTQFKSEYLANYTTKIAYIDLQSNTNRIYLRCESHELAKSLVFDAEILKDFNKTLLAGTEEYEYIQKITKSRSKTKEKNLKSLKKKDKIIRKASEFIEDNAEHKIEKSDVVMSEAPISKHVIFDE